MVLRSLLALLRFFTSIPVGKGVGIEDAARGFYLIPLIGLIEGAIVGGALYFAKVVELPALIASCVAMALHAVVTGGLHLDGFIDYSEAVASHRRGAEALRVMKDPRKGAFALIAMTLFALTWFSALCILYRALQPLELLGTIVIAYVASSECMYVAAYFSAPEPYQGLGKLFVELSKSKRKAVASIAIASAVCTVIASALRIQLTGIVIAVASGLATAFTVVDSRRRLGYANGDVLGFCYELSRIVSLLSASVVAWFMH